MKVEELRRLEEEKLKERQRQMERELQESRKKKGEERILSYDLTGRLTEVANVPSIPSMMFSCELPRIQQVNPAAEEAKMTLRKTLIKPKAKKKSSKEATDVAMLIAESRKLLKTTESTAMKNAFTLKGLYDSFNPTAGVTFYESGKNVKESTTFKDKAGRFNKSEFLTYLSEASLQPNSMLSINTSTLSNKFDKTDKQEEYTELKHYRARGQANRVDVTGDLTQLWEGRDLRETEAKGEVSINPSMYVMPSKKLMQTVHTSRTATDFFNMGSEFESGAQSSRGPNKMLALKNINRKPSKFLLISIVNAKRSARERLGARGYGVKLPPPPLGRSTGHGIYLSLIHISEPTRPY
eukprot:TRINITY_DN12523_c0_g1_i3.p1 TRINITY_DN12523_c0_g1~~TRINITY_DN12523_c0_g1_i3.p1  ORF type:complete len:353 (+),score=106.56 TRINITY_DN12523_c0_g1_i3:623-1681(+)